MKHGHIVLLMGLVPVVGGAAEPKAGAAGSLSIASISQTPWILKDDGQLKVEVVLHVRNTGSAREGWVRITVPGKAPCVEAAGELAPGDNKLTVRHPELGKDGDKVAFELFGGRTCEGPPLAARVEALGKTRHWTVYVNHDMHQDVGYTAHQEDLKRRIWPGYLDKTFQHIADSDAWDEPSKARRGIESSMLLYDSALLARDADWIEMLKRHIANRRIGYSATFGSLAQENMSAEELARSCYYSRRHLHDMLGGGCAAVANMADNNSLCWSAIDTLVGAGIRYYTLRLWGGESRWRRPAALYYVEASRSGKRLLVYDYGDYTKEPFGLKTGKIESVRPAVARRLMDLQRDPKYPYDAFLCQFTNSDNGPTNPAVYRAVKDFNALGYEYPRMICALPEDFYRHVEERFGKDIPVLRGHFENWWNWGVGSTARETAAHKTTQETLAAAELLATVACAAEPGRRYPYEDLATSWKNMVLYAEHTWGSNGSGVDNQWFWKRNTALQPQVTAAKVLRESMADLHARIPAAGRSIVVWNFAPWKRTDVARLASAGLPERLSITDVETGRPAALQRTNDGQIAFLATGVPAVGYKTFRVVETASPASPGGRIEDRPSASGDRLENRFYRVTFDPNGSVSSIVDKLRGSAELVDADCPHRLNEFVYWYQTKVPFAVTKAKLTPHVGPVMATMTAEGACFGVDSMKRTVILYRDLPRIDFVNDVVKSPSGFPRGWPKEEGYFVFPLNVPGFLLRHELPAGNVRPLVDPNPGQPEQLAGSCTDHYTVSRWVDVSNQKDFGVTLSCASAPLMMYGGRRARTFDVGYKAARPWLYCYVFNNLWYTNFQKTQPGRVVFRYSLRPHAGGDWLAGGAHRFGIETNSPLRAGVIGAAQKGRAGFDGAGGGLLAIDQPNVMLIAAKLAEANGEGVILRFNEIEGKRTNVTVDLARFAPQAVIETDLVENDRAPLALSGTKVSFTISSYGPATLRLTFGKAPPAVANAKAVTDQYGTHVTWAVAAGAAHYEVCRGTSADFAPGAGTYLASVNVNHFLDRQVHNAVKGKYYYKVRAAGPGRKGPFSPAAAATAGAINDTTPPAAPVLYAKALRFDKVALSWETPADDVAVKGYRLFRDGSQFAEIPAVYNSWMDLRTDPNKEYEYSVRAVDEAGNVSEQGGAKVSTHGFVVPPDTPPAEALQAVQAAAPGPKSPEPKPPKPGNAAPKAAVTVSSEFAAGFAGKHLVDGWCARHEVGEWSSKGQAKPWLRLEWAEPVTIGKVVLYDRANPLDHARAGRLTFSDGSSIDVSGIANDGSAKEVVFPARKVKWMKFGVTQSTGANIGLSEIEVFGASAAQTPATAAAVGPTTRPTSDPKLDAAAEVEAIVTAASKPRPPKKLGIYPNGFYVVKYDVRKLVSGRLEGRAIQAVHWSVRDRKVTPAAAIRAGEVHRLKLVSWDEAREQFKADQFAIDDDFVDIETPMYFVLSWRAAR